MLWLRVGWVLWTRRFGATPGLRRNAWANGGSKRPTLSMKGSLPSSAHVRRGTGFFLFFAHLLCVPARSIVAVVGGLATPLNGAFAFSFASSFCVVPSFDCNLVRAPVRAGTLVRPTIHSCARFGSDAMPHQPSSRRAQQANVSPPCGVT